MIISTHSPRVGRTYSENCFQVFHHNFNSLAPCGANPPFPVIRIEKYCISTHSPRVGRTTIKHCSLQKRRYFNSLAPCGANRHIACIVSLCPSFQLTRPVWGEPRNAIQGCKSRKISTHSPRVGRTRLSTMLSCPLGYFNSLAPCGANPARFA